MTNHRMKVAIRATKVNEQGEGGGEDSSDRRDTDNRDDEISTLESSISGILEQELFNKLNNSKINFSPSEITAAIETFRALKEKEAKNDKIYKIKPDPKDIEQELKEHNSSLPQDKFDTITRAINKILEHEAYNTDQLWNLLLRVKKSKADLTQQELESIIDKCYQESSFYSQDQEEEIQSKDIYKKKVLDKLRKLSNKKEMNLDPILDKIETSFSDNIDRLESQKHLQGILQTLDINENQDVDQKLESRDRNYYDVYLRTLVERGLDLESLAEDIEVEPDDTPSTIINKLKSEVVEQYSNEFPDELIEMLKDTQQSD